MLNILIAEDHDLYRYGMRTMLHEVIPESRILEAGDFPETEKVLQQHPEIALLFLDIHMPGVTGLDGLKKIKQYYPLLPVVVVSTVDQSASIRQMLMAGADAFIAKSSSRNTMIKALHKIMDGETVIISDHKEEDALILSPRQLDTLEFLAQGISNKEIAAQLNISPATVREYVSDIISIFNCDNRTQAVIRARQLGFILD